MKVKVAAIGDGDLIAVSRFLHQHLNPHLPVAVWEKLFQYPWMPGRPNHGFLLKDDSGIVGVFAAVYAERNVRGTPEPFCNLAAWHVLPAHRAHAIRLLSALLAQRRFHFVDLTPSATVQRILLAMKFQQLPGRMIFYPNLPLGGSGSGASILDRPEDIARALSGEARQAYLDHREVGACSHLAVSEPQGACHVVYHSCRTRGLPAVAVLHASDRTMLTRKLPLLGAHFLHHGAVVTKIAGHLLHGRPWASLARPAPPLMYLSRKLGADDFDYLYSERMLLPYYYEGRYV